MTIYELVRSYYAHHPNGHYFDHDTLKHFGETLSSMRILERKACIKDCMGEVHVCYILSKRSRKFDGSYFRNYAYFDVETFDDVIPGDE